MIIEEGSILMNWFTRDQLEHFPLFDFYLYFTVQSFGFTNLRLKSGTSWILSGL